MTVYIFSMHRIAVLALAFFAVGCLSLCHASTVKSLKELSPDQIQALQQSESRLRADDLALDALQKDRHHKRISADDFYWQSRDLTAYVGAEAKFQNDLLTKNSTFTGVPLSNGTRDVLRTVGKYSIIIPGVILEGILKGGGNISP